MKTIIGPVYYFFLCVVLGSCNKLTEVPIPTTSITSASVFSGNATAISAVTSLYTTISASTLAVPGTIPSLSLWAGLSGDELTVWSGLPNLQALAYFRNSLSGLAGGYGTEYWEGLYQPVYACNSALQGLNSSTNLSPAVKQQLLGEAKFMRAFYFFYLTNLYGAIPLPVTTNGELNSVIARSPADSVYQRIIADLQYAAGELDPEFVDGTLANASRERVRPTRWAALALLARAELYAGDWANAEKNADTVIANVRLFGLSPLDTVFLRASSGNNEAIWQVQPVDMGWNTNDAQLFILPATGPPNSELGFGVFMSQQLVNAFEPGDMRRVAWVDSVIVGSDTYFYPFKYKSATFGAEVTEYLTILRLAEVYLIRAEARAEQSNFAGAAADLNIIRARAGLGPTSAGDLQSLLAAILHERQVELFTEFGHRWLDIKRTHAVDAVMTIQTALKGGIWNSYQQLYPVPMKEIGLDPNLGQNPGY